MRRLLMIGLLGLGMSGANGMLPQGAAAWKQLLMVYQGEETSCPKDFPRTVVCASVPIDEATFRDTLEHRYDFKQIGTWSQKVGSVVTSGRFRIGTQIYLVLMATGPQGLEVSFGPAPGLVN